jgi:hypothetical protein
MEQLDCQMKKDVLRGNEIVYDGYEITILKPEDISGELYHSYVDTLCMQC